MGEDYDEVSDIVKELTNAFRGPTNQVGVLHIPAPGTQGYQVGVAMVQEEK